MEWTSSTAEIDSLLPTIMELYQRRTAQLGQFPNLLTDAAYRRFLLTWPTPSPRKGSCGC
jgi:hypothetical protein